MTRPPAAGFALAVAAVLALSAVLAPAVAATEKATKSTKAAKTGKPAKAAKDDKAGGKLIETYGDWTASLAQGKAKTCYALAKPKERSPEGKHDQAYVFIADRPAEKVHNEVSIIPGFPIKEGSAAKARVGKANFDLVAVANAFFMKDAGDDTHFVDAMKRGGLLVVKAPPLKGPLITDTYSLSGFKQALDRAQKECR
jgi:invasion protein IalB